MDRSTNLHDERKRLWDYLEAEGIMLTTRQHSFVSQFIKEYSKKQSEMLLNQIRDMEEANRIRKEASRNGYYASLRKKKEKK